MDNILVRRMLDWTDGHYAEAVTLRTLSDSIGRQPAYLGRLFRREVGSSFHEYLTQIRMQHAAQLIREGVKIEAVALCVGYRSKKNFYQQFRRQYATNPVPYRCRSLAPSQPDCDATLAGVSPELLAPSAEVPPSRTAQKPQPVPQPLPSDAESSVGRLSSVVRATNRAWRLAVRAQELLVQNFGHLQMAVLLTDHAGRYITANRAALEVTGYSTTELSNLSPTELFVDGPGADVRSVWQFLLSRPHRPDRGPNAIVRRKTGDSVSVYLVTLRNLLTERHGTAMLERLPVAVREPFPSAP